MNPVKTVRNTGFTLLEMAGVVAILGVLALIVAPSIVGSTTTAKATQLQRIADTAADNWFYLTLQAGSGTAVQPIQRLYSGLPDSTLGPNGVLFLGRDWVEPAYYGVYDRSGVRPLDRLVARVGSTSQFTIVSMPGSTVDVTAGGKSPLLVTFGNIPSEVVQELMRKVRPETALVYGTPTTVAQITYTCPAPGARCTSVVFSKHP
jgi:prepilin-type N-terminal cleavage/methylation domain-containing protein